MAEENKALVVPPQPGELMAAKANEMAKAMIEFLPGGNTLPEPTRRAMAMLAVNNGLDPFLGEVYAVPQKRKDERTGVWSITGYALGIGRGGWLRNAERSGLYQGNEFRFCTPEEEAAMGVQKGDVAMCCNVFKAVSSVRHSGNYRVSGFGVVGADEKSKMNHFQLARKRAFVDALRNAFPMAVPKVNGEQMQVRVVDDETGEILGNGHDLARECEPTAPLQIAQAEETQSAEFTEASATPYQPEGMPVVATTPAQPAAPKTNGATPNNGKHWIYDTSTCKYFWGQVRALGFNNTTAHANLGVQKMEQFKGTVEQALDRLRGASDKPVEAAPFSEPEDVAR